MGEPVMHFNFTIWTKLMSYNNTFSGVISGAHLDSYISSDARIRNAKI